MDARSLIETLKGRGLSLRVEGDRIKVEAPQEPGPETKALLSELRRHREEVKMILAAPKSETPTPETLAASLLVENEPDEVETILAVWRDIFGMRLDRDQVVRHLEGLRRWQSRWAR
ncbi:MAG: hypothetical protein A2W10_04335 [Deltaproteobacteria bacterium RBG_16_55_12]|nr:MAG: hypothetical protein A2W10_04335 [Deltaproteobacteria bacterium RBG_16_55_12]